jgi:carboxyl-terminal processing protease
MAAGKNRDARIAIWLFISMFLFASGIRCQYGAEPRKYPLDSETQDALSRFTDVYVVIKREYVAPVPFPDLIENTLKGLQDLLGKERLSYVRSDHRFLISCSGENITVNEVSDEYRLIRVCTDIFALVKRTNPQLSMPAIVDASAKGLAKVDAHSSLATPEEYRELLQEDKGQFAGIGVEICNRDGVVTVVFPAEGGPASKAGIKSEDQIIMIDGKPTMGLSLMEAIKLLRGEQGTPITITIMRDSFLNPKDVTLAREILPKTNVRYELFEGQYGYIQVHRFNKETDANFEKAAENLNRDSHENLKGLILDLRFNPGGLLDQAVKTADRFIESGLIVSVQGNSQDKTMMFQARQEGTLPAYPLIVLANKATGAGSEIILGALQDHQRAIIFGNRTLGEATIQTIFPLRKGYFLRLTTAIWRTPNGNLIEKKGIVPELYIISEKEASSSSLHLDQPKIFTDPGERDTALRIALEVLKRTTSGRFADLMAAAKVVCDIEQRQRGIP